MKALERKMRGAASNERGEAEKGCQVELISKLLLNEGRERGKKKKVVKRIAWADEVGRELIQVSRYHDELEGTLPAFGKIHNRDQK